MYRKVNYYLIYTLWSQIVAMSEWWSRSSVRIYFADQQTLESYGLRHTLYLMNHRYELDWLFCWMCVDKFNILGNSKSFAKKSLRWVPVIGWGWLLDEFIFLSRNWDKDSQKMGQSLDKIMSYETPISLLLFCEGTRFTQSKYEQSLQFAKQRGLPLLKYHLLPRVKGFSFCIQHIKQKYPETVLIDIQLKFANNMTYEPTFTSIIKGKQCIGDIYLRKIPLSEVPTHSDEHISKFLYDLYQKKDQLMEFHDINGKFPGIVAEYPRRLAPLINWMTWFVIIMVSLIYILWYVLMSGNWYLIIPTTSLLAFGLISVYIMIGSTKIKKESKYGKIDIKSELNPNNNTNDENLRKRLTTNKDNEDIETK